MNPDALDTAEIAKATVPGAAFMGTTVEVQAGRGSIDAEKLHAITETTHGTGSGSGSGSGSTPRVNKAYVDVPRPVTKGAGIEFRAYPFILHLQPILTRKSSR